MKALLLILALSIPAWAEDCKSWKLLVVGGEMQPNTWDSCSKRKKEKKKPWSVKGSDYQLKMQSERDEYARMKQEEFDRAMAKRGNGYGDRNHRHVGPGGKAYGTTHKSVRDKKNSEGKGQKGKQGLPRVSKQKGGEDSPRSSPQARVKGNSKS